MELAIEFINKALGLFNNVDLESLGRRPDELLLIKLRYHSAAANLHYIKGDYENAKL